MSSQKNQLANYCRKAPSLKPRIHNSQVHGAGEREHASEQVGREVGFDIEKTGIGGNYLRRWGERNARQGELDPTAVQFEWGWVIT